MLLSGARSRSRVKVGPAQQHCRRVETKNFVVNADSKTVIFSLLGTKSTQYRYRHWYRLNRKNLIFCYYNFVCVKFFTEIIQPNGSYESGSVLRENIFSNFDELYLSYLYFVQDGGPVCQAGAASGHAAGSGSRGG